MCPIFGFKLISDIINLTTKNSHHSEEMEYPICSLGHRCFNMVIFVLSHKGECIMPVTCKDV